MKKKLALILTLGLCLVTACAKTESVKFEEHHTKGIKVESETENYNYYPLLMVAIGIDTENNVAICEDRYGNLWQFVSEDAFVGDLYSCIMTDNGSDDIKNHEIITARYAGDASEYANGRIIDTENIVGYTTTETGIMFHFEDGTGYYFEKGE